MLVLCVCGMYEIEQSTAEYRKGENPLCHAETCAKVRYHRSQGFYDHSDPGDENAHTDNR